MTKRASFVLAVGVNLDPTPGSFDHISDWLAAVNLRLMDMGAAYGMKIELREASVDGVRVEDVGLQYEEKNEVRLFEAL